MPSRSTALGDVNVTFVEITPAGTLRARYSTEHNGPITDTLTGTRTKQALKDVPANIDAITQDPTYVPAQ